MFYLLNTRGQRARCSVDERRRVVRGWLPKVSLKPANCAQGCHGKQSTSAVLCVRECERAQADTACNVQQRRSGGSAETARKIADDGACADKRGQGAARRRFGAAPRECVHDVLICGPHVGALCRERHLPRRPKAQHGPQLSDCGPALGTKSTARIRMDAGTECSGTPHDRTGQLTQGLFVRRCNCHPSLDAVFSTRLYST